MITEVQMDRLLKGYKKADKAAAAVFYSRPDLFKKWDCTTVPRFKMITATCLAETGGFTVKAENGMYKSAARIKEVWPTRFATVAAAAAYVRNPRKLFNFVYGGRMGNEDDGTDDDDGFNYRGRGSGQTTGKGNYRKIGKALGINLVGNPELLEDPAIALEAILMEAKPLWQYADLNSLEGFRKFSNGINAGNPNRDKDPNGWKDRKEWYAKVSALAPEGRRAPAGKKVAEDAAIFAVRFGEHSPDVKLMQERLWSLGYVEVGRRDGKFGTDTQTALLAFQAVNGLPTTPQGMDATASAALYAPTAAPKPKGSKPGIGMGELIACGSRIASDGRDVAGAGIAVATGGVVIAQQGGTPAPVGTSVADPGVIGRAGEWLTQYELIQGLATRVQDAWTFAGSHYWVLLVVGGGYLAYKGWGIISARVQDAQMGITSDTSSEG